MSSFKIVINLDVTALLSSGRVFNARNGRQYVNLEVTQRREADSYGNDICVAVERTREERLKGEQKLFVGAGESFVFEGSKLVEKGGKPIENLEVPK